MKCEVCKEDNIHLGCYYGGMCKECTRAWRGTPAYYNPSPERFAAWKEKRQQMLNIKKEVC